MLQRIHPIDTTTDEVRVADVTTPIPFKEGLDYSCPARGTWTIAHTSMLIPHSYQIFVCPAACLRGVVLSAEEFGGLERFSMVTVEERDFSTGEMEPIFINGVSEIINRLEEKPPCVLVYSSCVQHFTGCDLGYVFKELRRRFPDIDIIECFMYPTMRKTVMPPDELMRVQLYSALEPAPHDPKAVNIIGNDFAFSQKNELYGMLRDGGYVIRDLPAMSEYGEYKAMAESSFNIYTWPSPSRSAAKLERRLGQKAVSLPVTWLYDEIREEIQEACRIFDLPLPDLDALQEEAEHALRRAWAAMGYSRESPSSGMAVQIDAAGTSRPFGLAQLLLTHGFRVTAVYSDAVMPGDEVALKWLQENYPDLPMRAIVHYQARFRERTDDSRDPGGVLAIGQKAAYFSGTRHFVNLIQNGGLWGFRGIVQLAELMEEAAREEKPVEKIITVKAWGCHG